MGYNNAVVLLNGACKALYSNSTLKLYARSINQDDIDNVTNMRMDAQRSQVSSTYLEYEVLSSSSAVYPNIYEDEEESPLGDMNIERSSQSDEVGDVTSTITGYSSASSWKVFDTYYEYDISAYAQNTAQFLMLMGKTSEQNTYNAVNYWVATRYTTYSNSVHHMGARPVIDVPLDDYLIGVSRYWFK